MAISLAAEFEDWDILLEGDALSLVQQVTDSTMTPNRLIEGEVHMMRNLLRDNHWWNLLWIPREGNIMTHKLAQWGLHKLL